MMGEGKVRCVYAVYAQIQRKPLRRLPHRGGLKSVFREGCTTILPASSAIIIMHPIEQSRSTAGGKYIDIYTVYLYLPTYLPTTFTISYLLTYLPTTSLSGVLEVSPMKSK